MSLDDAVNDAELIDFTALELNGDGSAAPESVRAFVSRLSALERFSLLDEGMPTQAAQERMHAAMLYRAYQSPQLVKRYLGAGNPAQRQILAAILLAAPEMYKLEEVSPRYDIRRIVIPAVLDLLRRLDRSPSLADADLMTADLFAPACLGTAAMQIKRLFTSGPDAKSMGTALANLALTLASAAPKSHFPWDFWNGEGAAFIRSALNGSPADMDALAKLEEDRS